MRRRGAVKPSLRERAEVAAAGAEAMALGAAGAAEKKERHVRLQEEQLQISGEAVAV